MSGDNQTKPIRLSLSQTYTLRWSGVIWTQEGVQTDPRSFYTVQFQLLAPDAAGYGVWEAGAWETNPPSGSSGPFAATVVVGQGQPVSLNPGAVGLYYLHIRYQGTSETPAFRAPTMVEFASP